jgi:DNA-binding PadR family transcriptional regulator
VRSATDIATLNLEYSTRYRSRVADELSPTEAAVLGLLARAGAKGMSGYDLRRAFDESVGVAWAPTKGHMYAVLPRLVDQGLATSREVVQRNRPTKQVYRITRPGRAALRRWLAAPVEPEQERDMLLVKLRFADLGDPDDLLAHIRRRREDAEALRREMRALQRQAARDGGEPPFAALTRRYALGYAQFTLRWTAEAEASVARAARRRRRR